MKIYPLCIVIALANFVYIYGFRFDDMSEEHLVLYTPLWFLVFIFGIYGIVTEKLIELVKERKTENLRGALLQSCKSFGILGVFGQLIFFPLFFMSGDNKLKISAISALIWGLLLFIFFKVIFPEL